MRRLLLYTFGVLWIAIAGISCGPGPFCGDGIVQEGEECDDGNSLNTDACTATCKKATCGDGFVQKGVEECDDGAKNADDAACSKSCKKTFCGDGIVQQNEACDDGNKNNNDGCTNLCRLPKCGDGIVQDGEECDDGNQNNNDACLNTCKLNVCGDGHVYVGVEECDDGNQNNNDGCSNQCKGSRCGDGVVQANEECDDGNQNNNDACLNNCTKSRCGDGILHLGVELCDDGKDNGPNKKCTSQCTLPTCGDGIVQAGEECDDGNASNTDACLNTCVKAKCGDGFVQAGEECDDGNQNNNDGCTNQCKRARCGDGFVQIGVEECDDGNQNNNDACLNTCKRAFCGDGVVRTGVEDCDDKNTDNTDGCLINCRSYDPCAGFQIDQLQPAVACVGSVPTSIKILGDGFLRIEGTNPTVLFQGNPTSITNLNQCQPEQGKFQRIDRCKELDINIPAGLGAGSYQIAITNAVTKQCEAKAIFSVGPRPTITAVRPNETCEGRVTSFTLTGTGFTPSTQVTFSRGGNSFSPNSFRYVSATELEVVFNGLDPGQYDVTVSNGVNCDSTLPLAVTVYKNPLVFFVDPEIAYNQISLQATLYLTGLNGPGVNFVGIRRSGSGDPFTSVSFNFNPASPGKVLVELPKNLVPDDYDVLVRDAKTCENTLPKGFKTTNTTTLYIKAIDPPFGWAQTETPVTLTSEDPAPMGQVPFQNGVRVYLSPSTGTGLSAPLNAVAFIKSTEVTGVIPKLPVGEYDVVAVNPNGTVGVIQKGFRVTQDAPPVIENIAPGSIPNSSAQTVVVRGQGFRTGATASLECRDSAGMITNVSVTVSGIQSSQLSMNIASGIASGSVCVVRVTNTDGTYGEFSALGVTNPAENIGQPTQLASTLVTGRRAHAAVSGRPTNSARFLYVLGGDTGSTANALDSIEAASINRFGDVGAWRTLPVKLPTKLTLAAAQRVGRFLYIVGGNNSAAAHNKAYRAEVLRPGDAPQIKDVTVEVDDNIGLDPGLRYYRISAVMGANDANNPNGETLPSEPLPFKIPTSLTKKVQITLIWDPIPGAAKYRIYRSPTVGLIAGQEQLLAEVNAPTTQYTDKGGATGTDIPRTIGALGEWASLPDLSVAREGLGLGVGKDPTNANAWYLYAISGRNSTTAHRSYEYLPLTLDSQGNQTFPAAWSQDATNLLASGRWQLSAFSVDDVATTRYTANATWIFAGPGANQAGNASVDATDAGEIQTGGKLSAWTTVDSAKGYGGYGYAAVANQLFIFGGKSFAASNGIISGQLCGVGFACGGGAPDPPDLRNWNSAGVSLAVPRYLMGSVLESGHIYLIGGATSTGVTNTLESSVW
ncbi:MAG: DUF4215 domain-containing protein [Myxococcales bacterium]|nr:DUF4215 domain-containing protein [Myxococcales bacterium]